MPEFQFGFKELAERLGAAVVGEPLTEEFGVTFQVTTRGLMIYTPEQGAVFVRTRPHRPEARPALVQAVDISNWNGGFEPLVPQLREWGVERVVVRLSLERPALRQIAVDQLRAAQAAGFACDGYLWVYWSDDPVQVAEQAASLIQEAGVPLGYVWLDLEEVVPGELIGQVPDRVARLASELERRGQRVGIYSAPWWLSQYLPDPAALTRLPLWLARWDGDPSLPLGPVAGWPEVAGKQWTDKPLDRDVFRRSLYEEGA